MKQRIRAILMDKNNNLVLIKRIKPDKEYWVFPGGGVEDEETLEQALIRECKEELGVKVEMGELCLEKIIERENGENEQEYFYIARLIEGELGTGEGPEFDQDGGYEGIHEIHSVPISEVDSLNLYPDNAKKYFVNKFND